MNSLKDKVAVSTDAMYVILGASGNTGSIIADSLLSKGKKVRVVGRDAGRLQRFVRKGAEAFTGDVSDAVALTKAFRGARAAYLLLPPITSREDQERESDAIAKAVTESGLRYAVYLSSYGAHVPEGTGPVTGLHSSEQKLNADRRFERSAPARRVFHGEQSGGDRHDSGDGNLRTCTATRPEAAHDRDARRWRLRRAAPPGPGFFRQTNTRTAWRARPVDDGSHRGRLRAALANRICVTSSFPTTRCSRC